MRLFRQKRGFAKTIEAVIAVVLSFLFIAFFIPPASTHSDFIKPDLNLVYILEQDTNFRNCVMNENYSCLNATLDYYYPYFDDVYEYRMNVSADPSAAGVQLPPVEVHLESLMVAGNDTFLYPKTLRLYYWEKPLKVVRP